LKDAFVKTKTPKMNLIVSIIEQNNLGIKFSRFWGEYGMSWTSDLCTVNHTSFSVSLICIDEFYAILVCDDICYLWQPHSRAHDDSSKKPPYCRYLGM